MDVEAARTQMIDQQVRGWAVLDQRVLSALRTVPRERFVPESYRELAFADTAIPLGFGEHMLAPKLEGRILQALAPEPGDAVLEVGTGSGFLSACLATLGGQVKTVESRAPLAASARANLEAVGIAGIEVETADVTELAPVAHYDAVALTASLPEYDPRYEGWLTVGGRLFVVVGTGPAMEALLITRVTRRDWRQVSLFETVIDPLHNARSPAAFQF